MKLNETELWIKKKCFGVKKKLILKENTEKKKIDDQVLQFFQRLKKYHIESYDQSNENQKLI
jgi:hypothetical protein